MKAKELVKELMKHPDFDVEFSFSETDNSEYGIDVRIFKSLSVGDIGHADKIIKLNGIENN